MAYTTFQKTFWSDDYVLNLSRDEKLVYCYLITNDKTQQCGIYELAMQKACLELSMSPEELLLCLKKFSDGKKICYSMETQEICLINWLKHNTNSSWKTMESVRKQLANIKNPQLMLILYDPRIPLFDGTRKEKKADGKYVDTPYVIENPFMEYFKDLSDAQLLEIRAPYMGDKLRFMPLASPLYGAFANNTNRTITLTEHNNNKALTETSEREAPSSGWQPPTTKHKHGEYKHVLLTDTEYNRLLDEWGESETERMIKMLDEGIEMKGYKYKSHNLVMRKWRERDSKKGEIKTDFEEVTF